MKVQMILSKTPYDMSKEKVPLALKVAGIFHEIG